MRMDNSNVCIQADPGENILDVAKQAVLFASQDLDTIIWFNDLTIPVKKGESVNEILVKYDKYVIERRIADRNPDMSFITGSRAYGTPRGDSDIDIAILADKETVSLLLRHKDDNKSGFHFGRLNLIVFDGEDCEDTLNFRKWRETTTSLSHRQPVSRDDAIKAFQAAGCHPNISYNTKEFELPLEETMTDGELSNRIVGIS